MGTLHRDTFEAGSLPGDWVFDPSYSVVGGSQINGTYSLAESTAGVKIAICQVAGTSTGNDRVDGFFKVATPGTSTTESVILGCSDPNPANYQATATAYRASFPAGSTVTGWFVYRHASNADAVVASVTANQILKDGATYYYDFYRNGAVLTMEIQQVSDSTTPANNGKWLNSSVAWQTSRTSCMQGTDGSPLAAAAGYAGLRSNVASGATLYNDDIRIRDLLDPSVSPTSAGVTVGGTTTLTASNFGGGATWASSDTSKATVNASTGVVTGVAIGSVNIIATGVNDPTETITVPVTVSAGSLAVGTLATGTAGTTTLSASIATNTGGTSPYSNQLQTSPTGANTWTNNGSPVAGATATLTATGLSSGTAYDLRVVVTDSAGTPNTGTSNVVTMTTTTPPNIVTVTDSNWYFSPFTWFASGSTYKQANCPGAYFKVGFTGASATLNVSVAPLVAASVSSGEYPTIRYSIDGGPFTIVQLASSTTSIAMATGLAAGNHTIDFFVKGMSAGLADRWTTPVSVVRITGLTLAAGATTVAPTLLSKVAIGYGDSITESLKVTDATGSPLTSNDAQAGWLPYVARAFGCEYGQLGFGSQGYNAAGANNVPAFSTAYPLYFSGQSRLVSGLFSPVPDYAFIYHGVNDGTNVNQAAFITAISGIRAAAGANCKIVVIKPARSNSATNIATVFAAYQASAPSDLNTILVQLPATYAAGVSSAAATAYSFDGIHSNTFHQALIASGMVEQAQLHLGAATAATTYALDFGTAAPVAGERYIVRARIPAGTSLVADATITLGGTNLQYSATQGGGLSGSGAITIDHVTGTGLAYWTPTAAGTVAPSATNGSGLTNPTIATLTASAAPSAPAATSYAVKGIPSAPVVGTSYVVSIVLDNPASVLGVVTPTGATGIAWGPAVSLGAGAVSGDTTVTFTQAGTYTPAFTHTGLGFAGNPTLSPVTASAASSGDPTAIANAVILAMNANPPAANLVAIAGSTIAAANQRDDYLSTPVLLADMATANANATAIKLGVVRINNGVMLASQAPTATTFSANVFDFDGNALTTGAGGFKGMFVVPQGNQNFKRKVVDHTIVGTRHDFILDPTNPWPTGFAVAGLTFEVA